MIDELKQDLLVQYLLGELDPSTADKIRAELEARRGASGVCAANQRKRSRRWPTPHRPMEPPAGLSQRILQSERNASRFSARPEPKIIWLVIALGVSSLFCHCLRRS